jgi:putative transposase
MARPARVVAPGLPHCITLRGDGRRQAFFRDEDWKARLALVAERCAPWKVEVWVDCANEE